MPSIRDVAQAASVSPATVSLVLNNRPGAARSTRERVRSTAARLGYRLPRQMPSLPEMPGARQRTYNIALLCASVAFEDVDMTSEARTWIGGVRQAMADGGHHLTIVTAQRHCDDDHFFRQSLDEGEFHAVILLGVNLEAGYCDYVRRCGTPCVAFNRRPEHEEFSYVAMSNLEMGRLAIDYLVGLKHPRIAVAGNPDLPHLGERIDGAISQLASHGLEPACVAPLHMPLGREAFAKRAEALLDARPTAVFFADWSGARFVDLAASRGLQIPRDLTVVDVDNMGLSTPFGRVTSIGYDKRWVGERLGSVAIRLIEGRPHLRCIGETFETWIVEHDTAAAYS
jgi:LacI family transcriptional regulator